MQQDIEMLQRLYEGRDLYQGELHNHAKTGGTSDGARTLEHWKGAMEALELDFATILDHRQVRHMYLPEWDNSMFIGGTEPGVVIKDNPGEGEGCLHYNMVFSDPKQLEGLLEEFTEYEFTGGPEGHFRYRSFYRDRFGKLIDAVKRRGGFFVIPHPTQLNFSKNVEDYWFRDEIGMEVTYISLEYPFTERNYKVWTALLDMGKRIWACAGGDNHRCAQDTALTSIYAEEKDAACYISHLRKGDFVCGPIGIQMCVGDTLMGGMCDFKGQRLVVGVGKFHRSVYNPEHTFRMDVYSDNEVIYSQEISCTEPTYYAMDTDENSRFYRVEIHDVNRNLRLAIGNPIWNIRFHEKEEK